VRAGSLRPGRIWVVVAAAAVVQVLGAAALRGGDELPAAAPPAFAGPGLPVNLLFASSEGQVAYVPGQHRMNFDVSFGPFIPVIERDEDFDVGGTVDFKFQARVAGPLFLGAELAFASHNKNAGELLSDGTLNRYFLLLPVEIDVPLGGWRENPFSLRFGLAPGIQIADPIVDQDLQDALAFSGLRLEEDTFVAFNVRARVGLRMPVDPHFGFLVEAAFDWAEGRGFARIRDFSGATVDSAHRHINLSAVSVLFGFQIVF
jgi:hypothetical protein